MKKSILCLTMLWLFIACENNNAVNGNETDNKNLSLAEEADSGTRIDKDECYMLEECNELGEPIDAYKCILFERNAGRTFEEAYGSIKSEIELLVQRNVNDEKDGSNYDANKWELRQVVREVNNSPDKKLTYTSIELYMFSVVYNAYTIVYQYYVIDSEGNIYQIGGSIEKEESIED